MPLPAPRPGPPPSFGRISAKATAAIIDDASIDQQVRVAVLHELEASSDPKRTYSEIVAGEALLGKELGGAECGRAARAIPEDAFVRGLQMGWFGARLELGPAQAVVPTLQRAIRAGHSGDRLGQLLRALITFDRAVMLDRTRVTWYYFEEGRPDQPLAAVSDRLGLRLALPRIFQEHSNGVASLPFIVIEVLREELDDPRQPRFTDSEDLGLLEFWRPGGKTAPWKRGISGLDELVDRPVALGVVGGAYAFVDCLTD